MPAARQRVDELAAHKITTSLAGKTRSEFDAYLKWFKRNEPYAITSYAGGTNEGYTVEDLRRRLDGEKCPRRLYTDGAGTLSTANSLWSIYRHYEKTKDPPIPLPAPPAPPVKKADPALKGVIRVEPGKTTAAEFGAELAKAEEDSRAADRSIAKEQVLNKVVELFRQAKHPLPRPRGEIVDVAAEVLSFLSADLKGHPKVLPHAQFATTDDVGRYLAQLIGAAPPATPLLHTPFANTVLRPSSPAQHSSSLRTAFGTPIELLGASPCLYLIGTYLPLAAAKRLATQVKTSEPYLHRLFLLAINAAEKAGQDDVRLPDYAGVTVDALQRGLTFGGNMDKLIKLVGMGREDVKAQEFREKEPLGIIYTSPKSSATVVRTPVLAFSGDQSDSLVPIAETDLMRLTGGQLNVLAGGYVPSDDHAAPFRPRIAAVREAVGAAPLTDEILVILASPPKNKVGDKAKAIMLFELQHNALLSDSRFPKSLPTELPPLWVNFDPDWPESIEFTATGSSLPYTVPELVETVEQFIERSIKPFWERTNGRGVILNTLPFLHTLFDPSFRSFKDDLNRGGPARILFPAGLPIAAISSFHFGAANHCDLSARGMMNRFDTGAYVDAIELSYAMKLYGINKSSSVEERTSVIQALCELQPDGYRAWMEEQGRLAAQEVGVVQRNLKLGDVLDGFPSQTFRVYFGGKVDQSRVGGCLLAVRIPNVPDSSGKIILFVMTEIVVPFFCVHKSVKGINSLKLLYSGWVEFYLDLMNDGHSMIFVLEDADLSLVDGTQEELDALLATKGEPFGRYHEQKKRSAIVKHPLNAGDILSLERDRSCPDLEPIFEFHGAEGLRRSAKLRRFKEIGRATDPSENSPLDAGILASNDKVKGRKSRWTDENVGAPDKKGKKGKKEKNSDGPLKATASKPAAASTSAGLAAAAPKPAAHDAGALKTADLGPPPAAPIDGPEFFNYLAAEDAFEDDLAAAMRASLEEAKLERKADQEMDTLLKPFADTTWAEDGSLLVLADGIGSLGYSTASEELDSARALSLSIYDRLASLDQQLAALEVEEEELARTEKALEEALGEKVPS